MLSTVTLKNSSLAPKKKKMELNRKHFRVIIFYNVPSGLTQQQQCIDELNSIFGNEAPLRTSVYRWLW